MTSLAYPLLDPEHDIPGYRGVVYEPWLHAVLLGIPVHFRSDLPDHLRGATDGKRIWLNAHVGPTQARRTLAHELVHVTMGHCGRQPEAVEHSVRQTARARLGED